MNINIIGVQVPIGDASNGLCGGMVFTTRDYFEARKTPPPDNTAPSSGPLFDYLVKRLFDSFNLPLGPTKYMFLMNPTLPDHETWASKIGMAPHGRAWVMIKEEWPKIKSDIDNGRLSPLGLIEIKSLDPFQMGHNHQVLVYGYDLNGNDLVMHIYDPNAPNDDNITMSLNIGNPDHTTSVNYRDTVYCFFRVDYTFSSPPPTPVVNGTIAGTVTNASSNKPIPNASVTAGSAKATTGVSGSYSIIIAPGTYAVTASATTFVTKTASVTVPSGTTVPQNFALTQAPPPGQPGTVRGMVTDSAGTPINGATVAAGSVSTKTDSAGKYTLSNVPSGLQQVRASATGYNPSTKSATVIPNQSITVAFKLAEIIEPDCPGPRPRVVCPAAKPTNLPCTAGRPIEP